MLKIFRARIVIANTYGISFLFLISGNIIQREIHKIAHKLFPESYNPLYPIPSIYVVEDIPVKIEIYKDNTYIANEINIDLVNFSSSFFQNIYANKNKFIIENV